MKISTTTRLLSVAALAGTATLGAAQVSNAADGPSIHLPFPCGQTWTGSINQSSAHTGPYEIDFNRGGSPEADRGDTVTAAAAGTVVTSAHQGSANGYGNLVVIDHGSFRTFYAHLDSRAVAEGNQVAAGQKIGAVGNTTKPSRAGMSSHLHFEVRSESGSYPGNIRRAVFEGVPFTGGSVTSRNCGGPQEPQPGIPAYPGRGAFKLGQSHPAVVELDKALIRKGFARHHDGDGYQPGPVFSQYTLLNVQDFQKSQGWSGSDADGYPGPVTWERLMR